MEVLQISSLPKFASTVKVKKVVSKKVLRFSWERVKKVVSIVDSTCIWLTRELYLKYEGIAQGSSIYLFSLTIFGFDP